MFKCGISGVRKKNERRISEKKIKVFLGEILECEILLSSYFSGGGLCLTHVGASCCETWLKFEIKAKITVRNKKNDCGCRARA